MKKITIVSCDDWEGLFINGKLKYENHSISLRDLEREGVLKADFVCLEGDADVLEDYGSKFPELLSDLKLPWE